MTLEIPFIRSRLQTEDKKYDIREDEEHRLQVVGPSQLRRPAERDPLQDDWMEQYSEAERAPRTPDAGLVPAESPQQAPVQGMLRKESPVSP